jgi:flagellar hook-associated protein 2
MLTSIAQNMGFGSGLDTAKLVADLASASRGPKVARLDAQLDANKAKLSTLAQARSDLDGIANALETLASGGTLRSQLTPSDASAVSIVTNAGSSVGGLSSQLVISALAKAQSSYSAAVASTSTAIGEGTLTLTAGGSAHAVVINETNNSLQGLVTAINATGAGVTASIVSHGNEHRLVLKGQSGASNAFTLTTDAQNLNSFTTAIMTTSQAASDAQFTLDGIPYIRASNSLNDLISGTQITLKKADANNVISINSIRPSEAVKQTLQDFVLEFNNLITNVNAAYKTYKNNPDIRNFERQLREFISQPLTSHASIRRLSDIGFSTLKDGTVKLDNARLQTVLLNDPSAIEAMLNPPRGNGNDASNNPGITVALDSLRDAAVANDGAFGRVKAALEAETKFIDANRARIEARELAYLNRLEKQYSRLDARLNALKSTKTFLDQQIKIWNGDGN